MKYQDIYPRLHQPVLDPLHWALTIGGRVRHPLILSYGDLKQFSATEVRCAVPCAGNLYDESLVEQALWRGVPISALLADLKVDAEVTHAVLHSASGYSTSLSLGWLRRGILALEQDGSTLQPEQGFPARLIVPGLYGYKMPRWITGIDLTDSPTGFWEARGWRGDAVVPAFAAIIRPYQRAQLRGDVVLEGFAFSGEAPIEAVEVSVDDADWVPVKVAAAPYQLARWHAVWTPPAPGEYQVKVRAANMDSVQADAHSIVVQVTE